jgi:serine/threonine protein kinase
VNKGFDKLTQQYVAIKKIRIEVDEDEGIPATTLREISVLKRMNHQNIVSLEDVVIHKDEPKIYLIFNYFPYDFRKYLKNMQN